VEDLRQVPLFLLLSAFLLLTTACGDRPPAADERPAAETEPLAAETEPHTAHLTVFFSRHGETVPVRRKVEGTVEAPALEATLRELLRGPTPEEREQGLSSWFSWETAEALHSATLGRQGDVVVDFQDLASRIPAASSSAGSAMLLGELNATVFQYPDVRTVEYRLDGSCEAFWNWLQYDCQILTREEALPEAGLPHPSWEVQESGLATSLRGLSAVDQATAWISGAGGRYAFTRDGGATWHPGAVPGAEALDFRDVEAFPGGVAYLMSAGPGAGSRIYKTTDWGVTWTLQHANELEDAFFNGFAFWGPESGALVGDPLEGRMFLLLTEDGGETWERPDRSRLPAFEPGEYGFAASGTNIAAFGEDGLAVVSGGSSARVFLSRDRGRTWEVIQTPVAAGTPSSGIFSIAFRTPSHAVMVGGDYQEYGRTGGNIALSRDGGRTWALAVEPHGVGYRSCVAWREDALRPMWVAVGTSGSSYSEDGGRSWVGFDSAAFNAVAFGGPVGWAVGPEGRVARFRMD
jgi:photosystem II stability/assembly factor-like uncharacterized protein